ncbi:MAG: hypothetical protein ACR2PL_10860, partial [Dehalococcoidia bacterium]
SLEIAQRRFGRFGVVRIDLSQLESTVVDVTEGIPGIPSRYMLSRWVIHAQEVVVQRSIPAKAIEIVEEH